MGPRPALAQTDYDPRSMAWNGASELVRIASEHDIDVRPVRTLDWDVLRPGEAVLVMYPRRPLGVADLSAGFGAAPGYGHDYSTAFVAGWSAVSPPEGWTDAETLRLQEFLHPN